MHKQLSSSVHKQLSSCVHKQLSYIYISTAVATKPSQILPGVSVQQLTTSVSDVVDSSISEAVL